MIVLTVVVILIVAVIAWTFVLIARDGYGYRPGPRSHRAEDQGSSWPHRDQGPR